MVINKHGSFYIRTGWPTKILLAVRENPRIFSPNSELQAVDVVGMGRVMIKALRYWADAMGLIEEAKDQQGLVSRETQLFQELYDNDLYLQDRGSLWLLHRELARNQEKAAAWYWAFNEFEKTRFNKEEFIVAFHGYSIGQSASYAKSAYSKEFDCFKNTYVSDGTFDVRRIIEEDTIPFFTPLNLIKVKERNIYEKQKTYASDIPIEVVFYCILKDNEGVLVGHNQISIDSLLSEPKQIGKYFSIGYSTLIELLQILENRGRLNLVNNFGNRHIEVVDYDTNALLHDFFSKEGSDA